MRKLLDITASTPIRFQLFSNLISELNCKARQLARHPVCLAYRSQQHFGGQVTSPSTAVLVQKLPIVDMRGQAERGYVAADETIFQI